MFLFHWKWCNFLKTRKMAIFICKKSKVNLCILTVVVVRFFVLFIFHCVCFVCFFVCLFVLFFLHSLNDKIKGYSWARDRFIIIMHARNSWPWLSNSVSFRFFLFFLFLFFFVCFFFSRIFFRNFDGKLALLACQLGRLIPINLFIYLFICQAHVILWDIHNFCLIFFSLHLFSMFLAGWIYSRPNTSPLRWTSLKANLVPSVFSLSTRGSGRPLPLVERWKTLRTRLLESFNRPFPNYLWPLFQSESWCSSFHI